MTSECAHDWRDYKLLASETVATFSPWIKVSALRQCKLCYRLQFEMDYVPGEEFFAVIYTQGTTPNLPRD